METTIAARPTVSTWAVVSFILAFVAAPFGLALSAAALNDTKDGDRSGRGLAIAGLVIGILGTLVWAIVAIAAILVAGARG